MICKFCGNENREDMQYCAICGKELQNALLNSLVGINSDGSFNNNVNYNATLGGIAHKGFEDTGGGAASGPRRADESKEYYENRGSSVGTIIATILAIIALLGAAAYFLIFANNAPLAHLREYLPF
ncbi:MAG: zinc ribbon domain-containing protein [Ruminococcaceae bacterium]|nr:zinc ribbon domain-containing protein [Oscillospiraceae bacterium]